MWKFKSLNVIALTLILGFSGCASKRKAPGANMDHNTSGMGNESIEINGSSDLNKAGPLKTVYFAFDSSILSEDTKMILDANAEFLKGHPSIQVQIEGHSDERGGIQYNLALGERRAQSVKDYLVSLGVASKNMSVISFGKEKPLIYGHDETSWQKNRRANFVILSK